MTKFAAVAGRRSWKPANPRLGANVVDEFKKRLPEFEESVRFMAVGAGWVALDLIGHQAVPVLEGEKTDAGYYGGKLLWSIPFLLAGKLVSENVVKGSTFVRALTIGTVANSLMQVRYALTKGPEFNIATFLLHEVIVVPLSFLIANKPAGASY